MNAQTINDLRQTALDPEADPVRVQDPMFVQNSMHFALFPADPAANVGEACSTSILRSRY